MSPVLDTLAPLLQTFPIAMVTVVTQGGRPLTRPMNTLPGRFNGHVWLRADSCEAVRVIGRGAEVSLAYGSMELGRYVTVYGWAIVLKEPGDLRSGPQAPLAGTSKWQPERPLVCVTARAAEAWDVTDASTPRVFAFPHPQPISVEDAPDILRPREPRPPRLRLVPLEPAPAV